MRRSDKFGKVRELDANSPGILFGKLVRKYMGIRGYQNQDVAIRVYNDEERKSSVTDVLNGRHNPTPSTRARYRDALDIPQNEIDEIYSVKPALAPSLTLERIEGEIASLARSRHADQRTIGALADVIETLRSQLEKQEITYESLARVLHEFLVDIGAGKTDPILWPATLRAVSDELRLLRASLIRPTNESAAINTSREVAAKAIDLGDYETAHAELKKVSMWTGQAYREHSDALLNAAENYARSLASLGALALSQSDYLSAKQYYQQLLQIDALQAKDLENYRHSLRIAFTSLIVRSDDFEHGCRLFNDMKEAGVKPDTVSYNALIHLSHNYAIGRELLNEMKLTHVLPDEFTFNILIDLASEYDAGRALLDEMKHESINPDKITYNTLMKLASDYETVRELFDEMKREGIQPSEVSYNILINKAPDLASGRAVLNEMKRDGIQPDDFSYNTLIKLTNSCAEGREILDEMKREGIQPDDISYNTLIGRANDYAEARSVLDEMKLARVQPDYISYNALIGRAKDYADARSAIDDMKRDGIQPDEFSYNTLIKLTNSCAEGREILDEMKREGIQPNDISYNTLIGRAKDYADARLVIDDMKRGRLRPSQINYNVLVDLAPDFVSRRAVIDEMKREGILSVISDNALIGRAKDYAEARSAVDEMKREGIQLSEVSYNILINKAPDLASGRAVRDEMKRDGIQPNDISYNALMKLTKSSAEGREILDEMKREGIAPTAANCTTVLGRARDYQEARAALTAMKEIADIMTGGRVGDGPICAMLSLVKTFEEALAVALELRELGYFVGRNTWESVFAKPISKYAAQELIAIYNSLPSKFESALQSPIRQYRRVGRPDQALLVCLVSPHGEAAKSFYRDEYEPCKKMFEAALGNGDDEDNLHYAYGIAATLNKDWPLARRHLNIALHRANHEKRSSHIKQLLGSVPSE